MRASLIGAMAIGSITIGGSPACAQDFLTPTFEWQQSYLTGVVNSTVLDNIQDGTAETSPPRGQARQQRQVNLDFTPSSQRRSANLASFVAKARASDPEGARQLQQLFASTDIIGLMSQAIAPLGLRVDNIADAYTTYWVTAWSIANGQDPTPSRGQMQAVKVQAEQAMAGVPQLAAASDADKQQTAEAYLVQAAMMQSMFDNAADAGQRQQVAAAVRQGASASGFDLDAMQLTANGFVKR